jgi:hypothetical protein
MPRLNIYFCGSMRAGRQDVDLYGILVDKLQQANVAIGFSFFCFLFCLLVYEKNVLKNR